MTLNHRMDGPANAPVVVLGPSLGTTLELWEPQVAELSRRWRVLRFDLPGHGGSAPEPVETMTALAERVRRLMSELGVERAAYAGVSISGGIGLMLALIAPGAVASLAVCCGSSSFGGPGPWRERTELVSREGMAPVAATAASRWFTPGFAGSERYTEMVRAADPPSYAACCRALAGYDVTGHLSRVAAPTLVIAGAEDPVTPIEHAEVLAAGIPGARLAVIQGASHLANVEQAEAVTTVLIEHLEKTFE